jgi:hypothetical protein
MVPPPHHHTTTAPRPPPPQADASFRVHAVLQQVEEAAAARAAAVSAPVQVLCAPVWAFFRVLGSLLELLIFQKLYGIIFAFLIAARRVRSRWARRARQRVHHAALCTPSTSAACVGAGLTLPRGLPVHATIPTAVPPQGHRGVALPK